MSKIFNGRSVVALSAAGSLVALAPAVGAFASSTCTAGGTKISEGVCEIKFTATGNHTFTPTSAMTKIDAILVGAGGRGYGDGHQGTYNTYGGGGGDVKLVSFTNDAPVTLVVGAGGNSDYSSVEDTVSTQGSTVTTAAGGQHVTWHGGTSGNGNSGPSNSGHYPSGSTNLWVAWGGGGGAGGATTTQDGGSGTTVNTITGANSSLFSNDTRCFGGGGASSAYYANDNSAAAGTVTSFTGAHTCGAGGTNLTLNGLAYTSYAMVTPVANSGGGGAGFFKRIQSTDSHEEVSQAGADGGVIIRYQVPQQLANTGDSALGIELAAGISAIGLGAIAIRRSRRS